MQTLIVYNSQFGNTERIAQVIAEPLGPACVIKALEVGDLMHLDCDLLIVAGPTQRQGLSPALQALFERLPRGALKDVPAATFDTRSRMSRFQSGSAAERIASKLKRAGAHLIVPPESFFIQRDIPPQGEKRRHESEHLETGEEARAVEWVMSVLKRLETVLKQEA